MEVECQFKPRSAHSGCPDERRQLDHWGHLKLDGTKTLVEEQPRAGRDVAASFPCPLSASGYRLH